MYLAQYVESEWWSPFSWSVTLVNEKCECTPFQPNILSRFEQYISTKLSYEYKWKFKRQKIRSSTQRVKITNRLAHPKPLGLRVHPRHVYSNFGAKKSASCDSGFAWTRYFSSKTLIECLSFFFFFFVWVLVFFTNIIHFNHVN